MSSQITMDGRVAWIDAAKGVGIVLVVIGHALDGLFTASILLRDGMLSLIYFMIYMFHMPLFFFLSGLHVKSSLSLGRDRFAVSKLSTIVYPYIIWSAIQGSTQIVLASQLNYSASIEDVVSIVFAPIGHFWFLYALALCHAIACLTSARTRPLICAAMFGMVAYKLTPGVLSPTCYYFAFYALGVVVGPAVLRADLRVDGRVPLALGAAFICSAALYGQFNGWHVIDIGMLPVSMLGVATAILASMMCGGWMLGAAAWLGRMSLTIYLLHIMAAAGARVVLTKLGVAGEPFLYVVAGTSAGIIGPILVQLLLKRWGWLAAFGLAEPRASSRGIPAYTSTH